MTSRTSLAWGVPDRGASILPPTRPQAECVAYHTTLTKGFKKAVYSALLAPDHEKPLNFWRLFDTFGTVRRTARAPIHKP